MGLFKQQGKVPTFALFLWLAGFILVGMQFRAGSAVADNAGPLTIEEVKKAWQARQDKVRSARIVYNVRQTITKGAIERQLRFGAGRERQPNGTDGKSATTAARPLKDVTFDAPSYMLIDGVKVLWSSEAMDRSTESGEYGPALRVACYDGNKETALRKAPSNTHLHQGHVTAATRSLEIRNPPLIPLVMTFRPLVSDIRLYNIDAFEVTGRQASIAGKPCAELQLRFTSGGIQLWVDRSRDCILVRSETQGGDKVVQKIDVRYRPDAAAGWVPAGWEMVYQRGEAIQQKWVGTVSRCEINAPIAASEFVIDFPPNTAVVDEVKKEQYVVKPTGEKRVVPREDVGASYEQLIRTAPGEAHTGPRPWRWLPWGAALAGGLLLAGILVWWLNRRRRQANLPPGEAPGARGE